MLANYTEKKRNELPIQWTHSWVVGFDYYKYTKNNTAELCLSEDTDIIVYGCQYMLWNLNIDTGACDLYDLKNILTALNVTLDDLQQISALTMLESKKISNIYYIFNNHYYYKLDQKTQKNTGQTPNNFIWWFCFCFTDLCTKKYYTCTCCYNFFFRRCFCDCCCLVFVKSNIRN